MTTKSLVTWNIRHGGGAKPRCDGIIARLEKFGADVLVVTEFRNNATGGLIISKLVELGFVISHPEVPERSNSVLVASRGPIHKGYSLDEALSDQRHLWVVELGWIKLCAVYMPLSKAKLPYWLALGRAAADENGPDLFVGDFNTGNNRLDLAEGATPFIASEHFDEFGRGRLKDVWRGRNPEGREYSWYSTQAQKGFRLDHAFATDRLIDTVSRCEYIHDARTLRLSDHSALRIVLGGDAN